MVYSSQQYTRRGFSLAYDARGGTFSRLWQADFRSPNLALMTNGLIGRLLVRQAPHVYAPLHAQSLSEAISHWQAQRFTIATFATIGCHYFPHQETQNWGNMYSHKLYTAVIATYNPNTNQSLQFHCASCYLLRLLSFTADSELTWHSQQIDCTSLHERFLRSALTVSITTGSPE